MLLLAIVLGLSACANSAGATGPATSVAPTDRLYVSLGDSYAAGYQPSTTGAGATTRNGFAYQVADRAAAAGSPLRLVNLGCSGVTSTALVGDKGCQAGALGPGAPDYQGSTQADAATTFLAEHRGQVALVTVIVGGNDIKPCLFTDQGAIRPDVNACITTAVATLRGNLERLLPGIRAAVGPDVPVVGLTYPDMYLGTWLANRPDAHAIAESSQGLFRDVLNPALEAEYAAVGATFADITDVTGGYGPLPTTGAVPDPVRRVCSLTFYCQLGDVHPTTAGYTVIADQVLRAIKES